MPEGVPHIEAERPKNRPEDLEAARQLIAEHPTLSENPRVQTLLENDFVLEDGSEVDAGNFLAAMLDLIEKSQNDPMSLAAQMEATLDRIGVVHSASTRYNEKEA